MGAFFVGRCYNSASERIVIRRSESHEGLYSPGKTKYNIFRARFIALIEICVKPQYRLAKDQNNAFRNSDV